MLKGLSEGDKIEFKEILLLSEEQTGKRPSTYASQILDFDKDDDNHLYRLEIKFSNGDKWIGNWFKNKILCYLESIFLINGTFDDIDLTKYDIDQDEEGNNEWS